MAKDLTGRLRLIMMATLLFGMTGTTADLLLLAHYEDIRQVIPLTLIGVGFGVIAWFGARRSPSSIRALQAVMTLFVVAGMVGVVLHGQGNMEFQLEIDPSLKGTDLLLRVLRAKAPPALAPGAMVQLGLLGLAFTYRHEALGGPSQDKKNGE